MSIKSELTKGVFWIALAKYSGIIVTLIITAILARHVSPTAFGTMAVATVIMAFLDICSDMGLGVAIVQFKDLQKKQIRSLFTISIGIAVILTALLFSSSGNIALYYKDTTLIPIIHWLCICLFFNSLNVIPNGLMLKNKRFRAIAVRTLVFQTISGVGACMAALHGWGIYALLISPIVTSVGVFTFNFYNYPQCPILPIDMAAVKKVWRYSAFQFLFSFINYFSRNADKLIIGKYLSMKDLGYYEKSYRLMQMPLQNITFVITPVLHPILSTLQDNLEELAEKNNHLARILLQIGLPLGIILYFCASPIILIIFGDNWYSAIPVFRILALSVPLQMIMSTGGSFFQSAGKTSHMFCCGLYNSCCTVGGFIIAAIYFKTIESMAWAWDISLVTNFFFSYWFMNRYTFRTKVHSFFIGLLPQLLNSTVTVVVVFLFLNLWRPENPFILIIWTCLLTALPTVVMALLLHQYSLQSVVSTLLKKIRPKIFSK